MGNEVKINGGKTLEAKNRLRKVRKAQGLTLQAISVKAGCSMTTLIGIEKYGSLPTQEVRQRIASVIGVAEGEIWPELSKVSAN